jgi:hypothetical protein
MNDFETCAFLPTRSADLMMRAGPGMLHKDYRIRHRADAKQIRPGPIMSQAGQPSRGSGQAGRH